MKTIFITGASSGIGLATAKYFSKQGWQVIATMRNLSKGKELANFKNVIIKSLDITNMVQVQETCEKVLNDYDVDVLFNNAGFGVMAPLEKITKEEIQ